MTTRLLLLMILITGCASRAPLPAYVHTVGPTGYWNTHCDGQGRCMMAVDTTQGLIKFKYLRTQPDGDTIVARGKPR